MTFTYRHTALPPAPSTRCRSVAVVRLICAVVTLVLWSAMTATAATPTLVTGLELQADGPQTVRVSMSRKPETLRTFLLREPARLVMDIAPARLGDRTLHLSADHDLIHGVRIGQFSAQTVRVVFDLKQDVTHRVEFHSKAAGRDSAGVVVSLFASVPLGSSAATVSDTRTAEPVQPLADPVLSTPATTALSKTPAKETLVPMASTPDASAQETSPADASDPGADKKVFVFGQAETREETQEKVSAWGTLDLSGFLLGKVAQELHESGNSGQEHLFRNTVHVEGKWTPPATGDTSSGTDAGDTYVLASAQSDYLWFGPDNSMDDYDLDLFEAYLHHGTPQWDIRLGRQIVRWGKTDQVSPVDNLNPQDMREFFIPDLEDRKIPNWMARTRIFPGDAGPLSAIALEAVFVPFFKENEFDWSGNTWALLGVEDTGLRIEEEDPKGLENSDYGLRAAATVAGWDLAASWLQTTEKSPTLSLDPVHPKGPTLNANYGRQNIYGFEFETTLDKFGFRGEAAYFDRQNFNTEDFDPATSPMSHWILGLDYIGKADWYANVQFSHQHVFEYDDDILFLRRDNFYVNGELNKEFWRGNLMLKLSYAVDLHDGSSFLTPEAILTYYRNLELSLGTNLFFGPKDTLFGRYRDNDQAFLKAVYHF